MDEAGDKAPDILWHGFGKGVGFIAPADAESQSLMKGIVDTLEVAEVSFRAWELGEQGEYLPLTLQIPGTMSADRFPAKRLLMAAITRNKLPDEMLVVRSCKLVPGQSKVRLLKFGAKKELVEALKKLDGLLYVAASRLEVYYKGKRLLKDTKL